MGLDMYLEKKTYVKNWDHTKPERRHEITVKQSDGIRSDIKPERVSYIIEEVAYWCKANQIHKWFVDNIQNGKDDCGTYYVEREQLKELLDICKDILNTVETTEGNVSVGTTFYPDGRVVENTEPGALIAQQKIAEDKLPTQGGCFFGGTDYDNYYLQDLEETVRQLTPLLDEEGDGDFYYRSSW